jgi:hypothetical protein
VRTFKGYHHYLQHPGHTHFKETMNAVMYWKSVRTTIRSITRSCRSCQINKGQKLKYGHLLPKTAISNPWECLCVDLICPYTVKGKDNLLDFVALTMIDHAFSWFEIVELPVITRLRRQTVNGKELLTANKVFDKTTDCIAKFVNKTWLCRYPWCPYLIYNNRSEFKLTLSAYASHVVLSLSQPWLRIRKQMLYWNMCTNASDRCYAQLKFIWPNQYHRMMLMSSLTIWHGQFSLTITQYLKLHQVQPFLDKTCSSTFLSWLTSTKLENTGNH